VESDRLREGFLTEPEHDAPMPHSVAKGFEDFVFCVGTHPASETD
jgi:hypothetical protein